MIFLDYYLTFSRLIWRFLKRIHTHQTTSISICKRQRRRELFLTTLTAVSILEFIVCVLPLELGIAYTLYDAFHDKHAQSFCIFIGNCLVTLDAVLNPFWTSLVRFKSDKPDRSEYLEIVGRNSSFTRMPSVNVSIYRDSAATSPELSSYHLLRNSSTRTATSYYQSTSVNLCDTPDNEISEVAYGCSYYQQTPAVEPYDVIRR